jgi:hypothetical protein
MRPNALRRAGVVRQQQAVDDILEGLEQLRKKNEAGTSGTRLPRGITNDGVSSQQRNGYSHYKDHSVRAG